MAYISIKQFWMVLTPFLVAGAIGESKFYLANLLKINMCWSSTIEIIILLIGVVLLKKWVVK